MPHRALAAAAAFLAVLVLGTPAAAIGGVASIPHLVITPDPAVHQVHEIWLQVPGADMTFEAPSALGRLVGGVALSVPGEGWRSCHETTANQTWACGDNAVGVLEMQVTYDASSVLLDAATDYTVKVAITNNNPTSAGYGQRNSSSGTVTINPADVPTSDLKVTSFTHDTRSTDTARFFATIANGGPDAASAVLTFSGFGSTKVVSTDTTCTGSSPYTCRYKLAAGESVQYLLELAGNPANLTLTAKVSSANADPAPANNAKSMTLGPAAPSPPADPPGTVADPSTAAPHTSAGGSAPPFAVPSSAPSSVPGASETAEPADLTTATPDADSPAFSGAATVAGTGGFWVVGIVAVLVLGLAGAAYAIRVRSRHANR